MVEIVKHFSKMSSEPTLCFLYNWQRDLLLTDEIPGDAQLYQKKTWRTYSAALARFACHLMQNHQRGKGRHINHQ